ncbi:hypothetical protein M0805_004801 [Coniferiporia weirii]|nr:hypothetical protein M0805_004801 [Coniferiporia weirii]
MSFASTKPEPPFYLLLQHAPLAHTNNSPSSAPAVYSHPLVEYHFADDPPSALLPSSAAESVVVLDYDSCDFPPVVQSLHASFAIVGVKVTDAPGAAAAVSRPGDEVLPRRNDKMFIIETIANGGDSVNESLYELDNPQITLAQFKERNEVLRKVLG